METTELVLTFIADLAWPAVVITMFLLLRHPIKALIAKITDIIFKKGDTEVRVNIRKALEAFTEEKPGVILPRDVTPDNLNWDTFIRTTVMLQSYVLLYLNFVPLDEVDKNPGFHRMSMLTIEEATSLLKTYEPAAGSADVDSVLQTLRRRFAHILDDPS